MVFKKVLRTGYAVSFGENVVLVMSELKIRAGNYSFFTNINRTGITFWKSYRYFPAVLF
jgi:hypothetical protein